MHLLIIVLLLNFFDLLISSENVLKISCRNNDLKINVLKNRTVDAVEIEECKLTQSLVSTLGLKYVKKWRFSNCIFENDTITPNIFDGLDDIHEVSITGNDKLVLQTMENGIFKNYSSLKILKLSNLNLGLVSISKLIENHKNMDHIQVINSKLGSLLRKVDKSDFWPKSLKHLDLSNNGINNYQFFGKIFELEDLRYLNLSGNPRDIYDLKGHYQFMANLNKSEMVNLEILDFSWNGLSLKPMRRSFSEFPFIFMKNKPYLKLLNLRGNLVSMLTRH